MKRERIRRRLASVFIQWARQVMPPSGRSWAEAMQNELQHVPDEQQALAWAIGCLAAAYSERLRQWRIFDFLLVRLAVVPFIAFKVFDDLFATLMTAAYRLGAMGATEGFGQMTPGDDYARLIPLMEAIPAWLHGIWVAAAALYLLAAVLFIFRARTAYTFVLVILAVGLEQAAQLFGRPLIAATGVVVNPSPSLVATVVIPFVLPLMIALPIWLAGRGNQPPVARKSQA
jgi:hypothetical protein